MKPLVLIIDDDSGIIQLLSLILTKNGYDVLTASSAVTALNLLNHNLSPDIIITDYQMPHLKGSELIEKISTKTHLKNIPAVMITGSDPESIKLPQTDNFKTLIPKPFKVNTFLKTIDDILREKNFDSSFYSA